MRHTVKKLRTLALLTLTFMLVNLTAVPASAAPPLEIQGESVVLLDFATGQILYEKNPDKPIPPASLTKLMTLHLAHEKIAAGTMKLTDPVRVSTEAWAAKMPGSSVMFLAPGQKVTVGEIMKGIAVPSGNDASVALAEHMAGTVDAFVAQMNTEAEALGFKGLRFADPAGLSSKNLVTARQFAEFSRKYLQMHPESLTELHSVKEFKYPLWENLSDDEKAALARQGKTQATYKPIEQDNRNGLLWTMDGVVDGLKTGFIEESGYNIALTARKGEMRLIGVVLGVPGQDPVQGSARREAAGAALLNWGFQNFATVKPELGAVSPVRVWKGAANEVALQPAQPLVLTVPRGQEGKLTKSIHHEESAIAPVTKGQKLGEVIFAADGKEIARADLVAAADVPQGGLLKRLWDSIRLAVASWFAKKK